MSGTLPLPPNPQPGDTYIAVNGSAYSWDGEKWIAVTAPQTHPYLPLSGGQMGGPILLSNPTPTQNSEAASKLYVDAHASGGGGGTVTQVDTGVGLSGGPINTTGTIALADTTVAPGNYTFTSLSVDKQGRLTAASSGTPPAAPTTLPPSGPASGDLTGTYPGPTLVTANSNVGTFQGLTINAKGLVTAAANQNYLTANQTVTLTGDVTGSGATTMSTTLATVNSNTGSFTAPTLTLDGKGRVTAAAQSTVPIAYTYSGKPGAGAIVPLVVTIPLSLPNNLTGALAIATVAATASSVFNIQYNGTQIGTCTFAASATIGTFSCPAQALAVGDRVSLVAPGTQDGTLANVSIVLLATRA